jgi:hypothetical protein
LVDETISAMRKFQQKAKHKNDESKNCGWGVCGAAAFLGGRLRNDVVPQPSRYKNMAGHGVAALRLAPLSP